MRAAGRLTGTAQDDAQSYYSSKVGCIGGMGWDGMPHSDMYSVL